jgi:hypothetical protein
VSSKLHCSDGSLLSKPEDVIPSLGKSYHWKQGRSAFEAAYSWWMAQDVPAEIRRVLGQDPEFREITLEKATFEKQTQLDRFRGPSQTDVLALVKILKGRAIIGVEAKVDESFGEFVKDWVDGSENKQRRLEGLISRLKLDPKATPSLRYQLLHRCAAALIEAKEHGAAECAVIVQSFSPINIQAGFADFVAFSQAVGTPVETVGKISKRIELDGVGFRLGWAICPVHAQP